MITYLLDMKSKVGDRGQITIPKKLRQRLGIRPGQIVDFEERDGSFVVRKATPRDPVDLVYGILPSPLSTDELLASLRDEELTP